MNNQNVVPIISDSFVDNFIKDGWAVCDGFLSPEVVTLLAEEATAEILRGAFQAAGVGHGEHRALHAETRKDSIRWLDATALSDAQQVYWKLLDDFRLVLNRSLFLGLFGYEAHFAVFPPKTFYKRHLDRFQSTSLRTVSCILYLTSNWGGTDGGALRLYVDNGFRDVSPVSGRFVCFFSDQFYHEVRSALRERLSLTGWFLTRPHLPVAVI